MLPSKNATTLDHKSVVKHRKADILQPLISVVRDAKESKCRIPTVTTCTENHNLHETESTKYYCFPSQKVLLLIHRPLPLYKRSPVLYIDINFLFAYKIQNWAWKVKLGVLGFPSQFIKLLLNLKIFKWICLVRRRESSSRRKLSNL